MNRFLLLDSSVVKAVRDATLQPGSPAKDLRNPLFREQYWDDADPKRWEARYDNVYPSVVYDGQSGLYRAWYKSFVEDTCSERTPPEKRPGAAWGTDSRRRGLLYASSADGLIWEKPDLGIVEFRGSKENNIVLLDVEGGVFHDAHDPDPLRRFKFFGRVNKGETGMVGIASPDGLHWSSPEPWPRHGAKADTHNNAIWAPDLCRYVGITRNFDGYVRLVLRTESEDFISWSDPVEIMRGQDPYDELYSMPIFQYANVYIGLLAVMHGSPKYGTDTSVSEWNKVTTELAWSPDTVTWHRICPGQPLIPLGQGNYSDGEYDCGCIYAAAPIVKDDAILLYYGGSNGLHNHWREGSFNLARLRLDGFAGYAADSGAVGSLETAPFNIEGRMCQVNADIESGGSLRMAVLDASGCPIPGYSTADCEPFTWSVVDGSPRWGGLDLAPLRGRTVCFRFQFDKAMLYSLAGDLKPKAD